MSEKRFKLTTEEDICYCEYTYWKGDEPLGMEEVVDLLNEQQATIQQLKERNAHNFAKKMQLMKEIKELKAKLQEKEEDERLYANEIVELRKTNEEWLQFKELGGDY